MRCAAAQVLVDVLGVVTSVATMRSIKRKNDGTEFFCRDITIADAGCATHTWRPLHASVLEQSSGLDFYGLAMPPLEADA